MQSIVFALKKWRVALIKNKNASRDGTEGCIIIVGSLQGHDSNEDKIL